jgi:hypothetical protein
MKLQKNSSRVLRSVGAVDPDGRGKLRYAIIQRVKELSAGKIEWTDGMLYPVLHWLEDQGLVTGHWVESETGVSANNSP